MKMFRSVWWMPIIKVSVVTLGLAALVRLPGVRDYLQPDRIRLLVAQSGWWSYATLLVLGTCLPIALMPRWPFAVLCGFAYGIGVGVLVASLSGFFGAALHYGLAKSLLSSSERVSIESKPWFRALQATPRPFLAITAVRLFPLSNFAVTNLVCGLLRIPLGRYLGASALGMLPSTVVYVMAGSGALEGNIRKMVWSVAVACLAGPAAVWLLSHGDSLMRAECLPGITLNKAGE